MSLSRAVFFRRAVPPPLTSSGTVDHEANRQQIAEKVARLSAEEPVSSEQAALRNAFLVDWAPFAIGLAFVAYTFFWVIVSGMEREYGYARGVAAQAARCFR